MDNVEENGYGQKNFVEKFGTQHFFYTSSYMLYSVERENMPCPDQNWLLL